MRKPRQLLERLRGGSIFTEVGGMQALQRPRRTAREVARNRAKINAAEDWHGHPTEQQPVFPLVANVGPSASRGPIAAMIRSAFQTVCRGSRRNELPRLDIVSDPTRPRYLPHAGQPPGGARRLVVFARRKRRCTSSGSLACAVHVRCRRNNRRFRLDQARGEPARASSQRCEPRGSAIDLGNALQWIKAHSLSWFGRSQTSKRCFRRRSNSAS